MAADRLYESLLERGIMLLLRVQPRAAVMSDPTRTCRGEDLRAFISGRSCSFTHSRLIRVAFIVIFTDGQCFELKAERPSSCKDQEKTVGCVAPFVRTYTIPSLFQASDSAGSGRTVTVAAFPLGGRLTCRFR